MSAITTPQEVAETYGISPSSVRRYVRDGRISGVRVGPRLWKLNANEVRAQLGPPPGADADHTPVTIGAAAADD